MFIKNIYEGATYFHETNEIWHLFVVLMKEKDFYFDTFARKIDDMDHYQHAYFTTSGKVLDFNRKMDTHVVTLFRQIIKEQQTIFTEEIIMAKQTIFEKKIKSVSLQLGELMKANNDKEAWTKAGELNSLLKNEEAEKLPLDFLDQIRSELRSYYYINGEINKLHKQLYAKGNKLIELASF